MNKGKQNFSFVAFRQSDGYGHYLNSTNIFICSHLQRALLLLEKNKTKQKNRTTLNSGHQHSSPHGYTTSSGELHLQPHFICIHILPFAACEVYQHRKWFFL